MILRARQARSSSNGWRKIKTCQIPKWLQPICKRIRFKMTLLIPRRKRGKSRVPSSKRWVTRRLTWNLNLEESVSNNQMKWCESSFKWWMLMYNLPMKFIDFTTNAMVLQFWQLDTLFVKLFLSFKTDNLFICYRQGHRTSSEGHEGWTRYYEWRNWDFPDGSQGEIQSYSWVPALASLVRRFRRTQKYR